MNTLTYVKRATKNANGLQDGYVYMHHFGTGWQELVFSTHENANKFAAANDCEVRR